MAEIRRLVRIFLASPGDLVEERKAAKTVVDEFNATLADDLGYQVELVGWEDTISAVGRPQEIINLDLDRCEYFIGMLWKRWGTPPDNDGSFSSGFEEEFKTSLKKFQKTGRPRISLFFKEIDTEFLKDPGSDLQKVIVFQKRLISEKKILFDKFRDLREFETKIRRCITTYVLRLRGLEAEKLSERSQTPTENAIESSNSDAVASAGEGPLSKKGSAFLRGFILRSEKGASTDLISDVDVARFRLLSSIVKEQGNDEFSLGVHDANILFVNARSLDLGNLEILGLIAAGLDHYRHENVPLWKWLAMVGGVESGLLSLYTIGNKSKEREGALAAMREIAAPLDADTGRDFYLSKWFHQSSDNAVRTAALGYLCECGVTEDLPFVKAEFDRNDSQTTIAAATAFIRISLRDGVEKAIEALYSLQPSRVADDVVAALFRPDVALKTETLQKGVGHRCPEVRLSIIRLLRSRDAMPTEVAEKLFDDSNADIRLEALRILITSGRMFTPEEVRKILVKPAPGRGLLFAASDQDGENCLIKFQYEALQRVSEKELFAKVSEDDVFDRDAELALAERRFRKFGDGIRASIDDRYKSVFERALGRLTNNLPPGSDVIQKVRSLEDNLRREFTRKALDLICKKDEKVDLRRVREALKDDFLPYSSMDIDYLKRHGEWNDIPLIITRTEFTDRNAGLLALSKSDPYYKAAANAILKLGKGRLQGLFELPMSPKLKAQIVANCGDREFGKVSNKALVALLSTDSEGLRKASALMCVRALPKSRLKELLDLILTPGKRRYYNVVHWIDFGLSLPRELSSRAVSRLLAEI